eukprot:c11005_g1_i2.p1 GENE.c11005_g1_i2~~c11005_g1_i2.p1  ORF type:complete len:207 (+),score=28.91 c11005_g1_i2:290-910(+)
MLRFTVFDQIRNRLREPDGSVSPTANLVAGTLSGAAEAVVWTTPTERIKVLQQDQAVLGGVSRSTWAEVNHLVQRQGISGLFVGTFPTILKQSASVGMRFWLYGIMKDRLAAGDNPKVWHTVVTGGIVGGVSTVLNHPFDVIKSRMQAETTTPSRYKGTFSGLALIAREDGLAATMKGLTPRFTRVALAQAITFTVYEACLSMICG